MWSIARGFARNVETYKQLLADCDLPRRNALDGRGNLSEEALAEFTEFFLTTCLDQVRFIKDLVQPDKLRARIRLWAQEEAMTGGLHGLAGNVLDAILYRGELPRGDVAQILGTSTASRVISELLKYGVVSSDTERGPLRIAFPAKLAARWMPGLFPEQRG